MKKLIKKILLVLLFLFLPLTIAGCQETPPVGGEIEYFLTPVETEYTITAGESVEIEYETNIEGQIFFESFDEEIASVDENGLVTGNKKGSATIYVYSGNLEFEVTITVNSKPATVYTITIQGLESVVDTIETTRTGVALKVFLEQEYGTKMHPAFEGYIFCGYYTDKECTKELNLMTKLTQSITIYPKLVKDETTCDLTIDLSTVILEAGKITVGNDVFAITPDYSNTVAYGDETYENCNLYEVRYDYATDSSSITNVYAQGRKQDTKVPYDGYIIVLPKSNSKFDEISAKLTVGTKVDTDRYSIIVSNRLYVNREYTKIPYQKITAAVGCKFSALYDYTNKTMLFQLRADEKAYPASTNKVITALTAIQYAPSLDMEITIGDELDYMWQGSSPGTAGSQKGQVWTLRQLLYAMLLKSGNDSAYSVAVGVARSIPGNENKTTWELLEHFAELMNGVKDMVGATNSHFMPAPDGNSYYKAGGDSSTPHLWDDRLTYQYVTANDMIKFATLAFHYPALARVTSTHSKSFKVVSGQTFSYTNTNSLINPGSDYYYKYAVGLKTGTTTPGGQCLIFGAEVEGRFVIGAVLKASNRYVDALAILKAAFNN